MSNHHAHDVYAVQRGNLDSRHLEQVIYIHNEVMFSYGVEYTYTFSYVGMIQDTRYSQNSIKLFIIIII